MRCLRKQIENSEKMMYLPDSVPGLQRGMNFKGKAFFEYLGIESLYPIFEQL